MSYGFLIESMVSVLLLMTILYCVRLNKQLRLLKADEQSLRATISELITATEIAERAIGGLKTTMREGEQTLNERLQRSEAVTAEFDRQLQAGGELLGKLIRITGAGKAAEEPAVPDAQSVAAAAQAFAERARARLERARGMTRKARDFRLIPIVLLATVCLLGLKVSGIIFDGGYTLADRLRDRAQPPGLTVTDADSVPDYPKITFAEQAAADRPGGSGAVGARHVRLWRPGEERRHRFGRR